MKVAPKKESAAKKTENATIEERLEALENKVAVLASIISHHGLTQTAQTEEDQEEAEE